MKMAKVVIFASLITTFVLFLIFFPIKQHKHNDFVISSRRLGYKLSMPTFDPLIAQMKRAADEKKSSSKINNTDGILAYDARIAKIEDDQLDYFSEEGKLNITLRLLYLFPLIDNAPKDGVVSLKELEAWNVEQALDRMRYKTQKEIQLHDSNGDGEISFEEYVDRNEIGQGEAGWWKEQFMNADVDGNGTLNFDEFNSFLHPEDSNNEAIQKSLLRVKIEPMDHDHDGKLNYQEFVENTYNIYKTYVPLEKNEPLPTPLQKFEELDLNQDKFLEVEELKPIFKYLHPAEFSYAKYYSSYLINEADDNRDGNLTLDEMIDHEYIFYNTVYNNVDEEEDDYHNEL